MNPGSDTYQAARDQNRVPVATGQSNVDSNQTLPFLMDSVTGRLLVDSSGGASGTQVYNEVVAGSNITFTLAHSPIAGTVRVYANGQRLIPSGTDYTLVGAVITTVQPWTAGTIIADYSY